MVARLTISAVYRTPAVTLKPAITVARRRLIAIDVMIDESRLCDNRRQVKQAIGHVRGPFFVGIIAAGHITQNAGKRFPDELRFLAILSIRVIKSVGLSGRRAI